jgi:crotonobetainyl-CoA:carnitine CoA-transferase CaiB-like acyl-CoA transferase
MMTKPLEGIRILEWAIWLAGPGATMMLGDMGAEVIKIEQPVVGDPSRGITRLEGMSTGQTSAERQFMYTGVNRNKKCITIDVTTPKGKEIVYKLAQKCDVFLQNFRQSVRDRANLDYKTISQYNPKIIYANISSLGPDGPDAFRRGNDYVGQARSGFMTNQTALVGEPAALGGAVADHMTSIIAVNGILAALLARERLGIGQEIDVSITGSMVALQHVRLTNTFFYKKELLRNDRKSVGNPLANHYKCQDGKWIGFCVLATDRVWPDFCKALGIENLEQDPKFISTPARAKNARELIGIIDNVIASKTRDEWVEIIGKFHRIMFAPVNEGLDVASDPQILANNYVVEYEQPSIGNIKSVGCPIKFHKTPAGVQSPAPEFGQHTEEILTELGGYSWEDITRLKEEKVIG